MAFLHDQPVRFLGFDIAKETITVSDGRSAAQTIANSVRSIRALIKRFGAGCFAVCEPTGGHERLLLAECLRAGIACHRADTLKVKAFIRSFGTLAKSDAIDAAHLAGYGRERWRRLPLWSAPGLDEARLKDLVRRRCELVAMKVAEQNRAKAPGAAELAASFQAIRRAIERQIAAINKRIETLLAANRQLARRAAVCAGLTGVGRITAVSLISLMPELGTLSRRQAASLAGLAPHPNDSGASSGYRKTRGGRPEVRTVLFMPALQATAGRGEFATFYNRLVKAGKKPIAAVTAVMRKIVVTLNARLRDDQNN